MLPHISLLGTNRVSASTPRTMLLTGMRESARLRSGFLGALPLASPTTPASVFVLSSPFPPEEAAVSLQPHLLPEITPAREVQEESLYPPEIVKFVQAFPGSVPGAPGPV